MFRVVIFAALAVFSNPANGAFQEGLAGPVASAMGGASSAVQNSPWGMLANPALLPSNVSFQFAVSALPHRFGLAELAKGMMLAVLPTPFGTFGASASHEGFTLYREVTAAISGGWVVASSFHAGLSIRFSHLAIEGYGNGHSIGVQAGFLLVVTRTTSIGFSAGNINAPVIGQTDERLPQTYRTGIGVRPVDGLEVAVDLVKDILHPLQIQAGFQYSVLREVIVRAGTGIEPSSFGGGLGLRWSGLSFDYAFTRHPVLGITHSISAGIEL